MNHGISAVLLYVAALGVSYADRAPTLIDPENPARPSRNIPNEPNAEHAEPQVTIAAPQTNLTPQTLVTVKHIQFIGGTRYALPSLVAPFRPLVGKKVALAEIIALTNSITERYRQDGYPLSYAFLPRENFQHDTVRIVLVEGYIAHSDIKSDNKHTGLRLSRLAQRMMAEKPLRQATFDRYSLLMARTPATQVEANASLPDNIYGAATMQVEAKQPHIWDLSSTVDFRKGQNLALVNGTLSNLTGYGDQLGLATLIPLDKETRKTYFGTNYQQYLTDNGLLLQLKGSFYREDPRDYTPLLYLPQGVSIDARQKATQYTGGMALSYPLMLERKKQLSVNAGLDYVDKRNDYLLRAQGFGNTLDLPSVHQHARYPAAEFSVNGYREFDTASLGSRLTLRQGIDAFGADASPAQGTDLNFTRWKGNAEAAWIFIKNWRLSASLEGDWSDNDLPEAERVTFGAQRFGRGYPDGEASGDYGYGGQLELRYLHARKEAQWLKSVQPYVLLDGAQTWFNQQGYRHQRLASAAAGVMLGDDKHYTVAVEGARPLADRPSDSNKRDWRFSLTFTYNFNNLR
ncbi:ShlB/FhaC/HecB family hemolysin secretion/activation protein [Cedecea colo]|uniref:ShlB/FhaC/HecB family hemolysin secretion/activation protein n=1 Tax=Cedecea colo TaxID=2552946 RepID=A0ABX0VJD5_9ENTR|nr:ShlB/FhaC/HecB family hemolysin secretion/activation protein [Cedecea colo]NIY46636.1 ShlB/FhaC/HecB family hemolysin secretion/activation protein [Cedecea colo]